MRLPFRMMAAALAMAALAGCSLQNLWNEAPQREPRVSIAPYTPEPDERTLHPYSGELAQNATCKTVPASLLSTLEDVSGVGQAITFPRGAMVKANAKWWTVAVATQVHANSSGLTTDNTDPVQYFVSSSPSMKQDDFELEDDFTWPIQNNQPDEAQEKAARCLAKLAVPAPKPDPTDPTTYAARLAKHAKCVTVSKAMLAHLQEVGQVGGAITYAEGSMVKSNLNWWTVAVTTQVHRNGGGLTRENVARHSYFVTNDPSVKSSPIYFPLKPGKSDTAAAKARRCVGD